MTPIKRAIAMTTDAGQSWKGLFYLSLPFIQTMEDNLERTLVFVLWCICMAFVSWATVGSGGHKYADEPEPPDDDSIAAALRRARQ